jgi:hypothetical protein
MNGYEREGAKGRIVKQKKKKKKKKRGKNLQFPLRAFFHSPKNMFCNAFAVLVGFSTKNGVQKRGQPPTLGLTTQRYGGANKWVRSWCAPQNQRNLHKSVQT